MKIANPILIIDDDFDDRELLQEAWKELKYNNPLKFFDNGEDVIMYLAKTNIAPFLIISDVNLPRMTGFELRAKLVENPDHKHKTTPFIFLSSAMSTEQIKKAYDLSVHGIFVKEASFDGIKNMLMHIVEYWIKSKTPE